VNNSKILVTGANGLLGQAICNYLLKKKFSIIPTGRGSARNTHFNSLYINLDVTSKYTWNKILDLYKPSVIVNAAAMTNVDECEKNNELSLSTNSLSISNYLGYMKKHKTHFIQISTDFVFDGKKGSYIEDDQCSPLNFYGFTKLEAEKYIIKNHSNYTILRTSLIYGNNVLDNNLFMWVKQKMKNNHKLNIVDDQYRTPTYVNDLASVVLQCIEEEKHGIYHISSGERLSIFDIVCNIAESCSFNSSLIKQITSNELKQIAQRPMDSSLDITKAIEQLNFHPTLLRDALKEIT
jgi:dTDP-4-dehydrorhamnose reductase